MIVRQIVLAVLMWSILMLTVAKPLPLPRLQSDRADWLMPTEDRTNVIGHTIGVIVLDAKGYGKNHLINFYNSDQSPWYQYSFYDDDAAHSTRQDFRPFAFHPDYFVLALKCLRKTKASTFEVVVDEQTGTTKIVTLKDGNLKFQSWPSHILSLFAVDFNKSNNPLRRAPSGQAAPIELPKDSQCAPVWIKGRWLKIVCKTTEPANSVRKVGWILWRNDRELLVERFYIS